MRLTVVPGPKANIVGVVFAGISFLGRAFVFWTCFVHKFGRIRSKDISVCRG